MHVRVHNRVRQRLKATNKRWLFNNAHFAAAVEAARSHDNAPRFGCGALSSQLQRSAAADDAVRRLVRQRGLCDALVQDVQLRLRLRLLGRDQVCA